MAKNKYDFDISTCLLFSNRNQNRDTVIKIVAEHLLFNVYTLTFLYKAK